MQMKRKLPILMTLVVGLSAITIIAQDAPPPRGERPPPGRERPGGPDGQRFPRMPLMAALDPNNDGVIDEKEIEQASKSLKTLDKNNDGKITMEELRPQRADGPRGDRPNRPDRPAPDKQ
jgi:EF hand domain-containing protein